MMTRYDALYLASSPLLLPYLGWRWARRRKYRQSAPAMLGMALPKGDAARMFAKGSLWVHAVSVGEVAAARAIVPGLRELAPELPLLVSTITETGQAAARRELSVADHFTYFPADFSPNVRRFLSVYRPQIVVLMEVELWPNFMTLARASGARIFVVNGKLSDRSFPRYRRGLGLLRPAFGALEGVCVQTERDAVRFAALGLEPEQIAVTGNCKFDLSIEPLTATERAAMRTEFGIAQDRPVIIAGSTHPEEEGPILDAFDRVRKKIPEACLILAPRHPERFGAAGEAARRRGYSVARASEPSEAPRSPAVIVLDKMGALARAYGVAEVAIVAGSFCATGGHNLLEPAAHRVPVLYGPNMKSQRELDRLFKIAGAGTQVAPGELAEALLRLLESPRLRRAEGEKAFGVLAANQGSARRSLEAIAGWLSAER